MNGFVRARVLLPSVVNWRYRPHVYVVYSSSACDGRKVAVHRVRQKRQAVHRTDRPVNFVEVRMVVHTPVEGCDVRGVSGESGVAVGVAASEVAQDCLPEDARSWWGYCSYQYFHQVAH